MQIKGTPFAAIYNYYGNSKTPFTLNSQFSVSIYYRDVTYALSHSRCLCLFVGCFDEEQMFNSFIGFSVNLSIFY